MLSARVVQLAVASTLSLSTLGVATPAKAAPQCLTQGFNLTNLSSRQLKLGSVTGEDAFDGRPAVGTVIDPGAPGVDHELVYHFARNTRSFLHYDVTDGSRTVGRVRFTLDINDINQPFSTCYVEWGDVACSASGVSLQVLDARDTAIDVPSGQSGAQARVRLFNTLCSDNNKATCAYAPTAEEHTALPGRPWGKPVQNTTSETQHYTLTATDTISDTDLVEVGVQLSAKLSKAVEIGVNLKYQHTWTKTHTFTQSITMDVPSQSQMWVEEAVPVVRYRGDFTIHLGNTTWRFHDVQWDAPDPSPAAASGVFVIKEKPLTPAQRASLPANTVINAPASR
ncbi:hypothetical protein ACGFX8_36830 [Streptomyces sp. NPDC048362]|uniref:hypothetical protein n=1 Tax=Streptomyces sp. NPDC048362 TaxID=3365539 RepID=UPI003723A966